jgi:hypothetical protein
MPADALTRSGWTTRPRSSPPASLQAAPPQRSTSPYGPANPALEHRHDNSGGAAGITKRELKKGVRIVAPVLFAHLSFCFNFID